MKKILSIFLLFSFLGVLFASSLIKFTTDGQIEIKTKVKKIIVFILNGNATLSGTILKKSVDVSSFEKSIILKSDYIVSNGTGTLNINFVNDDAYNRIYIRLK